MAQRVMIISEVSGSCVPRLLVFSRFLLKTQCVSLVDAAKYWLFVEERFGLTNFYFLKCGEFLTDHISPWAFGYVKKKDESRVGMLLTEIWSPLGLSFWRCPGINLRTNMNVAKALFSRRFDLLPC